MCCRWKSEIGKERQGKHRNGSGSNPSPVTDGDYIFVYFKSGNLAGLDFDGKYFGKQTCKIALSKTRCIGISARRQC